MKPLTIDRLPIDLPSWTVDEFARYLVIFADEEQKQRLDFLLMAKKYLAHLGGNLCPWIHVYVDGIKIHSDYTSYINPTYGDAVELSSNNTEKMTYLVNLNTLFTRYPISDFTVYLGGRPYHLDGYRWTFSHDGFYEAFLYIQDPDSYLDD